MLLTSCEFLFGGYGLDEFFSHGESVHDRADSITHVAGPASVQTLPNDYTVIVLTDIHFGYKDGFGRAIDHDDLDNTFFNWLDNYIASHEKPAFCICLGDVVQHGWESEFQEYVAFCTKLSAKLTTTGANLVYTVLGNHDVYNSGWNNYTKYVFPTSFYRFDTNTFHWYFLDTASGSMGTEQMEAFSRALAADSSAPKIICTHYPVYADGQIYYVLQNTYERDKLITILAKRNTKFYMAGHSHQFHHFNFGDFEELNVPTYLEGHWALVTIHESSASVSYSIVP